MTSSVPADRVFELEALASTVRLQVTGAGRDELAARLVQLWQRCNIREVAGDAHGAEDQPRIVVALDPDVAVHQAVWDKQGIAGASLDDIDGTLASALTYRAIEASRGELLMVHAAGLADQESGRTAMLVGASGAGKSTLCEVLGPHFGYVTDETVALTHDLRLLAYPKPLSLFSPGRTTGKLQHSPDDLGLQHAPEHLTLGPVVFLARDSEADEVPEVAEVPISVAVARIAENASFVGELERPLHRIAELLRAATAVVSITYRDAADVRPVLTDLFAAAAPVPAPDPLPHPPLRELGLDVPAYGTSFVRTTLMDLYYDDDGGTVLTLDSRVIALSAISVRALTLIDDDTSNAAELAVALSAEFGDPPELVLGDGTVRSSEEVALRHTDDIVADLIAAGLVEHV